MAPVSIPANLPESRPSEEAHGLWHAARFPLKAIPIIPEIQRRAPVRAGAKRYISSRNGSASSPPPVSFPANLPETLPFGSFDKLRTFGSERDSHNSRNSLVPRPSGTVATFGQSCRDCANVASVRLKTHAYPFQKYQNSPAARKRMRRRARRDGAQAWSLPAAIGFGAAASIRYPITRGS
jgi:hypothetical protein